MTHVTCRLTAKNRDQFRNLTLGNRAWATFTVFKVPPLSVTPVEFPEDLWRQKTRVPGLSCGVVCVILCLAVLAEHQLVAYAHRASNTLA